RERESRGGLARGVETEELAGDLHRGLLGLSLRGQPLAAAERREAWRRPPDVASDLVDPLGRERDDIRARKAELEVLADDPRHLAGDEPLEPRDAVILVDDVIAGPQVREKGADLHAAAAPRGLTRLAEAADLRLG